MLAATSWMILGLAAAGCGPAEDATDNTNGGAMAGPPPVAGQCLQSAATDGSLLLAANPVNNYQFSSTIDLPVTAIKPNSEITLDWSALNQNFLGRPVNAMTDVEGVAVLVFRTDHTEMLRLLNADELDANVNESAGIIYTNKAKTSASTFELVVPGEPNTVIPRDELLARFNAPVDGLPRAYTVMAMKPVDGIIEIGQGTEMITSFVLDPASTNTTIPLTPTSTVLTYNTELEALTPVSLPPGRADITIDWTDMTDTSTITPDRLNALGRVFKDRSINKVMIGHYSQNLSEIEAKFLSLDDPTFGLGLWQGTVEAGKKKRLDELTNAAGQPFAGIDGTGTWIVALQCGDCSNPAPWFLTVLTACDPNAAPAASAP
jgi:hypothetical protein